MIEKKDIMNYIGSSIKRAESYIYVEPCKLLRDYISNYTISFPNINTIPSKYTILPNASSTIVMALDTNKFYSGLNGINTVASNVGKFAGKMKMLFIIEFVPGGMLPFIKVNQSEMLDLTISLELASRSLNNELEQAIVESRNLKQLFESVDFILLNRLKEFSFNNRVLDLSKFIIAQKGKIGTIKISQLLGYSEKHARRLFENELGISPKKFTQIIRINHAVKLMKNTNEQYSGIAIESGYFDQAHFIHEFRSICGITPRQYRENMSLFYNNDNKI